MQSKRTHPQRLQLSATQLVASVLAAVTATVAASYLGVNGTVIGAAVASVLTVVGNAVYSHSIHRTSERVRIVAPAAARRMPGHPIARTERASVGVARVPEGARTLPAAADGAASLAPDPGTSQVATAVLPRLENGVDAGTRTPVQTTWRRIGFTAIGIFAVVVTLLTSVELVSGRPLSDLLRGTSGSGTTVFGSSQGSVAPSIHAPQPQVTITETVVPTVVTQTPTITHTAPAVTVTPASSTPTPSPSTPPPTPSTSPTVAPTP